MSKTKIPWATDSWNPVVGCSKVSAGCENCYAEAMNKRFHWIKDWNTPEFFPERLKKLNAKQKPKTIFVCSTSDLFHEDVKYAWIYQVVEKIIECKQHTFMFLTKRPLRMKAVFETLRDDLSFDKLSNLWLGVTAENQEMANKRIPILLDIPAAKHFVSLEPMLGELDLSILKPSKAMGLNALSGVRYDLVTYSQGKALDFVIVGCESGRSRRKCKDEWVQRIINDCKYYKTPLMIKQLEQNGKLVHSPFFEGKQYLDFPKTEE